jgi:hypothetical protein
VLGIDLEGETAIPADEHQTAVVDLVDDASVTGAKPGFAVRIADELDSHSDRDSRPDPGRELPCTLGIHVLTIGTTHQSYTLQWSSLFPDGRRDRRTGEVALGRRTAPNSTA